MDILNSVWQFVAGLPRDLMGDAIDTWYGVVVFIAFTVITAAFAVGGYRSIHEFLKAADLRFDKDKLDRYNLSRPEGTAPRMIDWEKARTQQVRSWRFVLPFGALVLAVLYYWLHYSFDLRTYFVLAGLWMLFMPVLRIWWIATAVWTDRKLVKKNGSDRKFHPLHNVKVSWAVRHYLSWGLQKSAVKRPPYIGLLRPLNPFIKLAGLRWIKLGLIRPLLGCAFLGFVWGPGLPWNVFYKNHELDDRHFSLEPWWAPSSAMEPKYTSGAIPESPGDAQVAFGG